MSEPTSLLVVTRALDSGGAERFASTLLSKLNRAKVRPEVAVLRDETGYPLAPDIPIHRLGYRGLLTFPAAAQRLRKLVQNLKFDAVLSNITATNVLTGYALRGGTDRPRWIARVGNSPRYHDSILRSLATRRTYPQADLIVANSQGLMKELQSRFPDLSQKIRVIANLADYERLDQNAAATPAYTRSGSHPLIIAMGRLCQQKRYDVMLDAFAKVRKRRRVELWICGDGPHRRRIERQIQELRLTDDVRLLGFCRNPHALMIQADLYLMTSDHEGSPNALIEAQVLGVPAVATRCPHGPDEIILDRDTGLLVPVGDADRIADGILGVLDGRIALKFSEPTKKDLRQRFDAATITAVWESEFCRPPTGVSNHSAPEPVSDEGRG